LQTSALTKIRVQKFNHTVHSPFNSQFTYRHRRCHYYILAGLEWYCHNKLSQVKLHKKVSHAGVEM